jgi:hypothetical protein
LQEAPGRLLPVRPIDNNNGSSRKRRMKYSKIFFIIYIFISCDSHSLSNKYEIWGVWNFGPKEYADRKANLSIGIFFKTDKYLYFEPSYYGDGPRISYDSGYYKIKEIISSDEKEVILILEHTQTILNDENQLINGIITGKLLIHFMDENHIWLELDYDDETYQTNEQFEFSDFQGLDKIFWRAEKF